MLQQPSLRLHTQKAPDVFLSVQTGDATYGVVPFENSSHGSVVYTLDILADKLGEVQDVQVCGEIYIDIDHYLVGFGAGKHEEPSVPGDATPTLGSPSPRRPRSQPLKDVSHIKRIYSHSQAFGQCSAFIAVYLKGAEQQEVNSTSRGAELVAQGGDATLAAIASKTAAQVHDLTVLAKCIQDRDDNKTRFLVLQHPSSAQHPRHPGPSVPDFLQDGPSSTSWRQGWKTLVGFTIDHRRTGALADALNTFKTNNLNLTSINSRPSQREPWHYIFFVEFEGRLEESGGGNVHCALRGLESCTEWYRWYGSWKNRNNRA